jgi:diguanylate cyclase (GGDEF)-like protein
MASAYPVPDNEAERLEDLRRLAFLYEEKAEDLERICEIARAHLGLRTAGISLVGGDEVRIISRRNIPIRTAPRAGSPAAFTILSDEIIQIPDMLADPRTADLPIVRGEPHLRFLVAAPLGLRRGVNVGVLSLWDTTPQSLSSEKIAMLRGLASIVCDMMRLHVLKSELARREAFLMEVADAAKVGGWEVDPATGALRLSRSALALCGFAPTAAPTLADVAQGFGGAAGGRIIAGYRQLRDAGTPFDLEGEYRLPSGERRWLRVIGRAHMRGDHPERLVGALQDTTAQREAEAAIEHLAHHDPLTGLPNRLLFNSRLAEAIAQAKAASPPASLAVMILDFDHFKDVNDIHGHAAGDALLEEAARRLTAELGPRNTVARLGGDEFGLIVRDLGGLDELIGRSKQLVELMKFRFEHDGAELGSSASLGVTLFPDDHADSGGLLKNADIALYLAKTEGRGRAAFFRPELRARIEERNRLLADVRRGVRAGQFEVYYQPIMGRERGAAQLAGLEALMRWHHPARGTETPAFFGIAFDEPELAQALGQVAINQVLRQMRRWRAAGLAYGYVSINLAPGQVNSEGFLRNLAERLRVEAIPPGHLTLEITENVYLSGNLERVMRDFAALRDLGVRLSLDDFGTGYASLSHLQRFPVDQLKVDRSFVMNIGRDAEAASIANAVINLGQALGMDVVAEGVETREQAELLAMSGCAHMQGFYFARPLSFRDATAFLQGTLPACVAAE